MGLETSKHANATYQPKGEYALSVDLNKYQPKGNYLSPPSGDQYTLKSYTDATYQPKSGMSNYALQSELNKFTPKAEFDSFRRENRDALENNLIKTFLPQNYQKKGQPLEPLSGGDRYLLKGEIDKFYQPKTEMSSYATRGDIEKLAKEVDGLFKDLDSRIPRQAVPTVVSVAPTSVDRGVTGGVESYPWVNLNAGNNSFVPIRYTPNEDIQCMSSNNTDCYWKGSSEEVNDLIKSPPAEATRPVTCGTDAYQNKDHWCYKGMKQLRPSSSKIPTSQYLRTRNYLHY